MTAELNLERALHCADLIAATAQLYATTDFRRITSRAKADGSDVTETDLRIERMAAARIRESFSDHALLGEEATQQPEGMPAPASARYCWVIDPLDGTRNYARGLACFTTSIALLDRGEPVVGLIRNLLSGECYTAIRGRGAHRGTQSLTVSDRPFDRHAIVTFQPTSDGSTYDRAPWVRCVHVRNFGTTALHLALIAEGSVDAGICEQNRIWDVAAGALLVSEAGGVITTIAGNPLTPFDLTKPPSDEKAFLASSPQTHAKLIAETTA